MGTTRGAIARDDGVTIVEVLLAAVLALAVAGAAMGLLIQSLSGEGRTAQRTERLAELQVAGERMVRELRDATAVRYAAGAGNGGAVTGRTIALTPRAGGEVTFDCTPDAGRRCVRRAGGVQTAVLVEELVPAAPAPFALSCRSATGRGYADEGQLLAIAPPGTSRPAHCETNPAGHVALRLEARVGCAGQALTACPQRSVRIDSGVGLPNAL